MVVVSFGVGASEGGTTTRKLCAFFHGPSPTGSLL